MTPAAGLWVHAQTALLLLLPAAAVPPRARRPALWLLYLPLALAAAWLPLGAVDLAALVYAYTGALSLPSLVLLGNLLLRRSRAGAGLPRSERDALRGAAAVLALLLYPMALGLGPFDPYTLGFAGPALPLAAAALAVAAWWRGLRGAAVTLLAALWAWALGLGESGNLWDYLVDAWLGLAALGWALARLAGGLKQGFNRGRGMYQNSPPGTGL